MRPVGRQAAARKYDLLSAMMAHALAGDPHRQRLVLRLMALITTRYNWQRDELTMGQREMARLWCVDERTVKRDMARLREAGWIVVKRQGARGRVSVLGLGVERILLDTRPDWSNIGEDFTARMGEGAETPEDGDPPNVVPFRRPDETSEHDATKHGPWPLIRARLRDEDPALFDAWFAPLSPEEGQGGVLHLVAPSRFHATYVRTHLLGRLQMAARRSDPTLGEVRVTSV
ncbi:DnaA N-terminal domain-containing protein [Paracoccus sp. Ld10]|uniref:DnaA N-terminal domain-containing protein n=1 Tax=Paracoccus sp. Ld10 TaxID=649158 RepID=UPI003865DE7E